MKPHNKNILTVIIASSFLFSCSTFSFYNVPVVQGNIFTEEDTDKLSKGLNKDLKVFVDKKTKAGLGVSKSGGRHIEQPNPPTRF